MTDQSPEGWKVLPPIGDARMHALIEAMMAECVDERVSESDRAYNSGIEDAATAMAKAYLAAPQARAQAVQPVASEQNRAMFHKWFDSWFDKSEYTDDLCAACWVAWQAARTEANASPKVARELSDEEIDSLANQSIPFAKDNWGFGHLRVFARACARAATSPTPGHQEKER